MIDSILEDAIFGARCVVEASGKGKTFAQNMTAGDAVHEALHIYRCRIDSLEEQLIEAKRAIRALVYLMESDK